MKVPDRTASNLMDVDVWMHVALSPETRNLMHWTTARLSIHPALNGAGNDDAAWGFFENARDTGQKTAAGEQSEETGPIAR